MRDLSQAQKGNSYLSTAKVEIVHDVLQKGDRIHNLGLEGVSETDFHQRISILTLNGAIVEKAYKGQTAAVLMDDTVVPGDLVYLVKKKGISGFFISAAGLALLTAATLGNALPMLCQTAMN